MYLSCCFEQYRRHLLTRDEVGNQDKQTNCTDTTCHIHNILKYPFILDQVVCKELCNRQPIMKPCEILPESLFMSSNCRLQLCIIFAKQAILFSEMLKIKKVFSLLQRKPFMHLTLIFSKSSVNTKGR